MRLNPRQLGWSLLASGGALLTLEALLTPLAGTRLVSGGACDAAAAGCGFLEGAAAIFLAWAGVGLFVLGARGFQAMDVTERRWSVALAMVIVVAAYALFFVNGGLHHEATDALLYLPHHRFHATGTLVALAGAGLAWPR